MEVLGGSAGGGNYYVGVSYQCNCNCYHSAVFSQLVSPEDDGSDALDHFVESIAMETLSQGIVY